MGFGRRVDITGPLMVYFVLDIRVLCLLFAFSGFLGC